MENVLCHGDLWSMNVLWRQNGGALNMAAVVDYQLKEAYRQYFPIGAFMIVPMVGPFFEMVCKSSDEEFKKKGMDIVMEKTECLLDDIFYFHDRNIKLRKGKTVA
ncbi:hypothetical protein OSTOST_08511 [Ostertagia ostertagi]